MLEKQEIIIRLIKALYPEAKIMLFGSRARNTARITSDIDLALDVGRPLSDLDIIQVENVLDALNIPQKIDVVDYNSVPEELKKAIIRDAVIWSE